MKLSIELVPSTVWWANVRDLVPKKVWDRIRKATYKQAGYRCEICGGRGPKWSVECHEVWHYDDEDKIQTLERMIALCPACHQVKHFGLTALRGKGQEAFQHLMKVNNWDEWEAAEHMNEAQEVWCLRSAYEWGQDFSYLLNYISEEELNKYLEKNK